MAEDHKEVKEGGGGNGFEAIFEAIFVAPFLFLANVIESFFPSGHGGHGHGHPKSMLGDFVGWMADWGISRALMLWLMFIGIIFILGSEIPNLPMFFIAWFVGTMPLWLPVVLLYAAWETWVYYVRSLHISHSHPILLEIKIPRDILKSPRAMELVFQNFRVTSGEVTFLSRAWHGGERPHFSFELASFGGEIHFYLWCDKKYRQFSESSIYAQYPEIEIVQVEDYMSKFPLDYKKYNYFTQDYVYWKKGPERSDEYPMKSYIDFELDKDPKEEFKIDPLAHVFETLSSLKPHEQAWVQILIRTDKDSHGPLIMHKSDWKKRVAKEINEIKKEASINPAYYDQRDDLEGDPKLYLNAPRTTWKQQELIKAMERNMGKVAFEVGMRFMYISSGKVDGTMITSLRYLWKPFINSDFFNWLRPKGYHGDFDYPWQDYKDIRYNTITRRRLDAFRRRSFFYLPWEQEGMVMTSETLATLYHFPSRTVQSPGLQRIPAKKSAPPINLPK